MFEGFFFLGWMMGGESDEGNFGKKMAIRWIADVIKSVILKFMMQIVSFESGG